MVPTQSQSSGPITLHKILMTPQYKTFKASPRGHGSPNISPPPLSRLRQLSRLFFFLHVLNTDLGECVVCHWCSEEIGIDKLKATDFLRSFWNFILWGFLMLNSWMEPCFHLWQHGALNCLIWAWMSSHIVSTGLFSFHTLQPAVTGPQSGRLKRIWTAILGARAGRLAWARAQTSRYEPPRP